MRRRDCSDKPERCRSRDRGCSHDAPREDASPDHGDAPNTLPGSDTAPSAFVAAKLTFAPGGGAAVHPTAGDIPPNVVVAAESAAAGVAVKDALAVRAAAVVVAIAAERVAVAADSVAAAVPAEPGSADSAAVCALAAAGSAVAAFVAAAVPAVVGFVDSPAVPVLAVAVAAVAGYAPAVAPAGRVLAVADSAAAVVPAFVAAAVVGCARVVALAGRVPAVAGSVPGRVPAAAAVVRAWPVSRAWLAFPVSPASLPAVVPVVPRAELLTPQVRTERTR